MLGNSEKALSEALRAMELQHDWAMLVSIASH